MYSAVALLKLLWVLWKKGSKYIRVCSVMSTKIRIKSCWLKQAIFHFFFMLLKIWDKRMFWAISSHNATVRVAHLPWFQGENNSERRNQGKNVSGTKNNRPHCWTLGDCSAIQWKLKISLTRNFDSSMRLNSTQSCKASHVGFRVFSSTFFGSN